MKKLALTLAAATMALAGNAQLLWKVSGNGSKGDSYIFGTHHIAPAATLEQTKGFNEALESVNSVYGEVDMSIMSTPEAQQTIMSHVMAPADSTLTKVLTAAQTDSVNAVLAKYTNGTATVANMDMFKPAMVSTQLAMLQSMLAFPEFSQSQQLDLTIQQKGRELGKPVKGLETLEQQFTLLMGIPISEQANDLMSAIRKDDKAIDIARRLAKSYTEANLAEIEKIMLDPEVNSEPASTEKLIYARNTQWATKLSEALKQETAMIAVGVGHLPGDKGLLQQLRNAGFKVEPVK